MSISVVIAWVNPLELLAPCLDSLERQSERRPDEIIIVARRDEAEQTHLRRLYPTVTLLSTPPNTPITTLRSIGIKQARGEIIAVTEDHCIPSSEWIAKIEQHLWRQDCDVVGGPVENAATTRLRDWAAFLTEYAGAVRPSRDNGESEQLPGNNIAYRRAVTDGLCTTLDRGLWESFYLDRLRASGMRLRFVPEMMVYHCRPFDFRYFVSQRFHFCRSFAAMRCQTLSVAGRISYALGGVILPFLLLARGLLTLTRKRRLVRRYLACLPLIGIYTIIGASGEMIGYLVGGGDSLVRVE